MASLTRRRLLGGLAPLVGAAAAARLAGVPAPAGAARHEHGTDTAAGSAPGHTGDHAAFRRGGRVDHRANGFDPHAILRDFDEGRVRREGGRTVREWTLIAQDKSIEVAPGVHYDAWTFNGRVPGPTLRAKEGERLRIRFVNGSAHPHTIHFHGIHSPAMDGVPGLGAGLLQPGERTVYEFDAEPFGVHVYHCHAPPLASHIAKGLHGMFIVDPKEGRPPADELVMVMNGFDTNFDRSNEVYAANTIPFAYMDEPIKVKQDELLRLYLANMLEFDLVNSYHLHGNFFEYFPTGTSRKPAEFTDTVMQCQGQRGILEWRFPTKGKFMFHAHQSEFTELGWVGFFEVV
ncbi:MAG TPA: multicopper oxidase domain-containing protein [Solirubrobacteraceae bacterium]|nr:multicopper oxidase domain-containing protein [Solirubrobacteraceae bacterium]